MVISQKALMHIDNMLRIADCEVDNIERVLRDEKIERELRRVVTEKKLEDLLSRLRYVKKMLTQTQGEIDKHLFHCALCGKRTDSEELDNPLRVCKSCKKALDKWVWGE